MELERAIGESAAADGNGRGPVAPFALDPGARLRAYLLLLVCIAGSVPGLHLYMRVGLTARELALHTVDLCLASVAAMAAFELGVRLVAARARHAGWLVAAFVPALAVGLLFRDVLPGTDDIRAKHAHSGYGDMTLRVLPVLAVIAWIAWSQVRRDRLRAELRSLEAALAAAGADLSAPAHGADEERIALAHDGGETLVPRSRIACLHAQENYCEYVILAPETHERRRILVRTPLARALAALGPATLIRTHRSHAVRPELVERVRRQGRQIWLELRGGERVPVARARVGEVGEALRRRGGAAPTSEAAAPGADRSAS